MLPQYLLKLWFTHSFRTCLVCALGEPKQDIDSELELSASHAAIELAAWVLKLDEDGLKNRSTQTFLLRLVTVHL